MKRHDALIEAAEEAIGEVFGDTSVSQEETMRDMRSLADFCLMKAHAIESDLRGNPKGS